MSVRIFFFSLILFFFFNELDMVIYRHWLICKMSWNFLAFGHSSFLCVPFRFSYCQIRSPIDLGTKRIIDKRFCVWWRKSIFIEFKSIGNTARTQTCDMIIEKEVREMQFCFRLKLETVYENGLKFCNAI